jgi:ATP-binding cassette subfamily F protein uup
MALTGVQNLTISFGGPALLEGIDLYMEEGDRLCLLGRNGSGKSTLLKAMAGLIPVDGGEISRQKGIRTAYLGQEFPRGLGGAAADFASSGEPERMLAAEQALTMLGVDPRGNISTMSGGERRRVLLAQVLAADADLLMLDEPTNHLDIDTILQLEEYLLRRVKSFIFVTHDRAFARHLANRVAEIDRGALYAYKSTYDNFLERREELLETEAKARALFDKRLAEEEAWLRRGVKARRTRNEGRVKALLKMRDTYRHRRERTGEARMEIHEGERTGDLVIETKGLGFSYGDGSTALVKDFSTMIMRGDRVGVVGPNGSGKTTLLKLLLAELQPETGSVRHGANLQPLYLDQMRSELDPDKSVAENIADGFDTITMNGRKKHVVAYLEDFLFSSDRARSPVSQLSGGELGRLLLARLFAQPSNLLVLDEPTNDLDVETLELLEELLQEYPGTILLVSHDRVFLDNVVTDCFVLSGGGRVVEYAGGYSDWRSSELRKNIEAPKESAPSRPGTPAVKVKTERLRKISYREQLELEAAPDRIAALEAEIETIHEELADPELYRNESGDPAAKGRRLEELELELGKAYHRWEELEVLGASSGPEPKTGVE